MTWRPLTAIALADTDGHPALNGASATVLLSHFADDQTFTLNLAGDFPPKRYTDISQTRGDGNNARILGGMHSPSTVAVSDAVGEAIAEYVAATSMQSFSGSSR